MSRLKAQSMLDYTLLIAIVVAALLIIGYFIRNSLSGKLRESADIFGQGEVYRPQGGGDHTDVYSDIR